MFEIKEENEKIKITTPYHPIFVKKIKGAGASWSSDSKTWNMDARNIGIARKIMYQIYGRDDTPCELIDVKVYVKQSIIADRAAITMLGKVIASAYGRDSEAKIGEGISFEEGAPRSGGSVKNWFTKIPEGSIFTIWDVPKAAWEQKIFVPEDGVQFEILEKKSKIIIDESEKWFSPELLESPEDFADFAAKLKKTLVEMNYMANGQFFKEGQINFLAEAVLNMAVQPKKEDL